MAKGVVTICPTTLKWARERLGLSVDDVVTIHFSSVKKRQRYRMASETLKTLEAEETPIDFSLVLEFAEIYHIPSATFFLKVKLPEVKAPTDRRTLTTATGKKLSSELMSVLWNVKRLQWIAGGLFAEMGKQFRQLPKATLDRYPERLAQDARQLLKYGIEEQKAIRLEKDQFDLLRSRIEEFGILVAKQPFPLDDARAFSVMHGEPFAVIVNSRDGGLSHASKTFSLMHEFCHMLLRNDGLCNDFTGSTQKLEIFCNRFAAEFLMPAQHAALLLTNIDSVGPEVVVKTLRKTFKISTVMALTYLVRQQLISQEYYRQEIDRLEEEGREDAKKTKHIKISPENRVLYSLGQGLVSLIVDARRQDFLAEDKAAEYLSLHSKSYKNLEHAL